MIDDYIFLFQLSLEYIEYETLFSFRTVSKWFKCIIEDEIRSRQTQVYSNIVIDNPENEIVIGSSIDNILNKSAKGEFEIFQESLRFEESLRSIGIFRSSKNFVEFNTSPYLIYNIDSLSNYYKIITDCPYKYFVYRNNIGRIWTRFSSISVLFISLFADQIDFYLSDPPIGLNIISFSVWKKFCDQIEEWTHNIGDDKSPHNVILPRDRIDRISNHLFYDKYKSLFFQRIGDRLVNIDFFNKIYEDIIIQEMKLNQDISSRIEFFFTDIKVSFDGIEYISFPDHYVRLCFLNKKSEKLYMTFDIYCNLESITSSLYDIDSNPYFMERDQINRYFNFKHLLSTEQEIIIKFRVFKYKKKEKKQWFRKLIDIDPTQIIFSINISYQNPHLLAKRTSIDSIDSRQDKLTEIEYFKYLNSYNRQRYYYKNSLAQYFKIKDSLLSPITIGDIPHYSKISFRDRKDAIICGKELYFDHKNFFKEENIICMKEIVRSIFLKIWETKNRQLFSKNFHYDLNKDFLIDIFSCDHINRDSNTYHIKKIDSMFINICEDLKQFVRFCFRICLVPINKRHQGDKLFENTIFDLSFTSDYKNMNFDNFLFEYNIEEPNLIVILSHYIQNTIFQVFNSYKNT